MDNNVRYPAIEVDLSGDDGNAFGILSKVRKALRKNGVAKETINEFTKEAHAGNYDALLATVSHWVTIS